MTVLARIDALAPEIAARAEESESLRRLPGDLARAIAETGAYRMIVPESLGGGELAPAEMMRVIERAAEADASAGWCVMIAATTGLLAAYLPPAEARAIFADPLTVTGGVFAPLGKAVGEGGHYRATGRWKWASGSANCQWLTGGCIIVEAGEVVRFPDGSPNHRMLMFPATDVELIDTWHTQGLCGTGSGDMAVSDIRVPKARSASLFADKPYADGPLYAFPAFGLLAIGIAAVASGNLRAAFADFTALALEKKPGGGKRTLAERSTVQALFAEARARHNGARANLFDVVERAFDLAAREGRLDLAARAEVRLAATYMTRSAAEIVRTLHDYAGGPAVFSDHPLQRRLRDAQTMTAHIMTGPATLELAGRALFGLPLDEPTF
jgi:alkylation response protein AidB-like acyl-CoA dehydrogenase